MQDEYKQSHLNLQTKAFPLGTIIPNYRKIKLIIWKI